MEMINIVETDYFKEGYEEYKRTKCLMEMDDDLIKRQGLSLLKDEEYKLEVIKTMKDYVTKAILLNKFKDSEIKTNTIVDILLSTEDDNLRTEFLSHLDDSKLKLNLCWFIKSDENLIKVMNSFLNSEDKINLTYRLDNDENKYNFLNKIIANEIRTNIDSNEIENIVSRNQVTEKQDNENVKVK